MLPTHYSATPYLAIALIALPPILGFSRSDRLPLHVRHGIGAATGERHNVVADVAQGICRCALLSKGKAARAEIRV